MLRLALLTLVVERTLWRRDDRVEPEEIDRALTGDRKAVDALVRALRPVIQTEVGFALLPLGRSQGRDVRQEALDLVQDVLMSLLADDGKLLRRWDPARGCSLESFVRLIARRHVAGVVRSKRRNPYTEHPLPGETLDLRRGDGPELEHCVEVRERLDHMLDRLRRRLDERGLLLFELLYVEERPIEDACEITGMTRDAVYAWRSRLKRQLEGASEDEPSGSDVRLVRSARVADNGKQGPRDRSPRR